VALEIERKFLVIADDWKQQIAKSRRLRQGYLAQNERLSVRVRIDGATSATLTIKTAEPGISRDEYEYPIPVADAKGLLQKCGGHIVSKVRHVVPIGDLVWEVDAFEGDNAGLVIAEVELDHAGQAFERPVWLGDEVTGDRRFYNAYLSEHPFTRW
jgi:adenylate cyclase